MCGQCMLLPWIELLKIDYTFVMRRKLVKKSKGLYQDSKGYIKFYFNYMKKYINLSAIDLSIPSRLHRGYILNGSIAITEYLPMSRS